MLRDHMFRYHVLGDHVLIINFLSLDFPVKRCKSTELWRLSLRDTANKIQGYSGREMLTTCFFRETKNILLSLFMGNSGKIKVLNFLGKLIPATSCHSPSSCSTRPSTTPMSPKESLWSSLSSRTGGSTTETILAGICW